MEPAKPTAVAARATVRRMPPGAAPGAWRRRGRGGVGAASRIARPPGAVRSSAVIPCSASAACAVASASGGAVRSRPRQRQTAPWRASSTVAASSAAPRVGSAARPPPRRGDDPPLKTASPRCRSMGGLQRIPPPPSAGGGSPIQLKNFNGQTKDEQSVSVSFADRIGGAPAPSMLMIPQRPRRVKRRGGRAGRSGGGMEPADPTAVAARATVRRMPPGAARTPAACGGSRDACVWARPGAVASQRPFSANRA